MVTYTLKWTIKFLGALHTIKEVNTCSNHSTMEEETGRLVKLMKHDRDVELTNYLLMVRYELNIHNVDRDFASTPIFLLMPIVYSDF